MNEETKGGSNGKKRLTISIVAAVVLVAAIVAALFATHVLCIHQWQEASCTTPKTCTICGNTDGDALGHDVTNWEVKTEPTCAASGQESSICNRCNDRVEADIPMLDHTQGDWKVTVDYEITPGGNVTSGVETLSCTECGAELDTREYTTELTNGQKNAVIRAYEEIPFWHPSYDYLVDDILVGIDGFSYEDAKFAVDHMNIDWDEQAVLYARENARGMSRSELTDQLRYYKFNEKQIENALKEAGY